MTQPEEDKLPRNVADAQGQADEAGGLARSTTVTAHKTGKKYKVPSVILLDDDQLTAYEQLHHKLNQCDRYPDVEKPAQKFVHKDADGSQTETDIGAHTLRGDFIQPYQTDGVLFAPPYAIQLATIFWGEEGYAEFKAGGGRSAEIPEALQKLNRELQERQASDSKSVGRDSDLAAGSDGDRS